MKYLLIILNFIILTSLSGQYGVENILRKYKNDSGVFSYNFSGDISTLFSSEEGEDIPAIKSKVENVDLIMFSEGKDLSEKDVKKLKEKIKDDNYEMLVQASSDGYKVKLMGIGSDEQISKIFAQIKGENQNIYLIFSGEIYLEDLTKLDFDKIGNIGF